MSNYYLCDLCRHLRGWSNGWVWKCQGINYPLISEIKEKKVMTDAHEHPEEVCPHFQPKIVEKSDIEGESPHTFQHSGRGAA